MTVNVALDKEIVKEVLSLQQKTNKKNVIEDILKNYVRIQKQRKALETMKTIEWNEGYNYKAARLRK